MTQSQIPPEGWFPDPQAPGQLRYWSGSAWTDHTAPDPAARPAAAIHTPAVTPTPQPAQPTAWTKQTFVVLFACIALLIAAAVASPMLLLSQRADHQAEARQTLEQFVAAATVGDAVWRDYASESLQQKVPVGAPIFGDSKTAEALDLSVEYTLGELEFHSTQRGGLSDLDDNAVAPMTVIYHFTFDGKRHTAEAAQKVWLTRPFYFGSELPQSAQDNAEPTAVGPWKVTSFTHAEPPSDNLSAVYYETDLIDDYDSWLDENVCFSALEVLQEVSDFARISGTTQSSCLVGDGAGTLVGDDVDRDLLASEFPVLMSEMSFELYSLPELTRVPAFDERHPRPPFQEYVVTTSAGQYVLTVALVEVGQGSTGHTGSARLVSVQLVDETEATND